MKLSTGLTTLFVPMIAGAPIGSYLHPNQDISDSLQNILANTHGSNAYTYPTDLTRNIVPKAIHSHNDYWRDVPFYTALAAGCVSIEADVWLVNETLYVGHELSALTEARTFDSLYIQPILSVLNRQNPSSPFVTAPTRNGVYDTSPSQTLYLYIDVKTDGPATWPYVVSALAPLRSAGYLTNYTSTPSPTITPGPITVIGTGNTPLNSIQAISPRDYFYDAPLELLSQPPYSSLTRYEALTASTDFMASVGTPENVTSDGVASTGRVFNTTQISTLSSQISRAAEMGFAARYWETPAWPVGTRNYVWRTLVDMGVGLLSVDALEEAAGFADRAGFWG